MFVTHNEQATVTESESESSAELNVTALLGPQQSCWVPLGCRHRLVNRSSTAPLRYNWTCAFIRYLDTERCIAGSSICSRLVLPVDSLPHFANVLQAIKNDNCFIVCTP